MTAQPKFPEIRPENLQIPEGKTLDQWMEKCVVRYATRTPDWDALKFQADLDPKYRRAQLRYVGTGGTGIEADDDSVAAGTDTPVATDSYCRLQRRRLRRRKRPQWHELREFR